MPSEKIPANNPEMPRNDREVFAVLLEIKKEIDDLTEDPLTQLKRDKKLQSLSEQKTALKRVKLNVLKLLVEFKKRVEK